MVPGKRRRRTTGCSTSITSRSGQGHPWKKTKDTHLLSQPTTELLRDALGDRHGCDTTRLSTPDLPPHREAALRQILGDLGCLPRPCLPDNYQDLVVVDRLGEKRTWKRFESICHLFVYYHLRCEFTIFICAILILFKIATLHIYYI